MAVVLTTSRAFSTCQPAQKILTDAGYELKMITPQKPMKAAELVPMVKGVSAMLAGLDEISAEVIEAASPTLKIIARNGVGYDKVDLTTAKENNIRVTITPGANSLSVCELAFSFITGLSRKIHLMDKSVREKSWQRVSGIELYGKTIGILGTGAIGRNLAVRCRSFGMRVLAYDLYPSQELIDNHGVEYTTSLDDIYREADFISLHLPANKDTHHMINRDSIAKMKKGAFIINTARGELINDDDLFEALKNNELGGAGLDAFVSEPFLDERFFTLDNVIMTPHTGAFTKEAADKTLIMAAEEIVRALSGKENLYQVN
ncbi:D-3-phosphoglycerate dehydrogenase [Leminorella richardii]|uniref:D-3-phosphoglycerate dehydrogenase n=1 Tax=Leminorella richardii TaxID=158841 RepID=A0A2X4ULH1_9GAMM|nr:phosphoglycerate dehydrogenase [Leminorella richardii]SQI36408.1 D-3-phosphoglycerate dehydrogenase [Leminorella richardii]